MDRALDDVISDRQRNNFRSRDRRPPRDGIRKTNQRDENRNIDHDWVHDRFDDEDDARAAPRRGGGRGGFRARRGGEGRLSPGADLIDSRASRAAAGAKLRIDNLHYDLTEDDLRDLFTRKGPIDSIELLYDRQDRSRGTAFVTYIDILDAKDAIRDFDGANANGQPIRLTLLPPPAPTRPRNPFDTAERPSRSLFERIEAPITGARSRSDSPRKNDRRSDVRKPAPEGIDRYIPGGRDDSRRRSPMPRRGEGRRGGGGPLRRPGERRRGSPAKDGDGHAVVQGRPRKTQEELDAEMEDYWGAKDDSTKLTGTNGATQEKITAGTNTTTNDNDIDMIE